MDKPKEKDFYLRLLIYPIIGPLLMHLFLRIMSYFEDVWGWNGGVSSLALIFFLLCAITTFLILKKLCAKVRLFLFYKS